MEFNIFILILIAEVIALIGAAKFSHGIYRHNRLNNPWRVMTIALSLMALTVISKLIGELSGNMEIISTLQLFDNSFIELLIALSFFWALANMNSEFDDFDVIEKNSKNVAKKVKK